MNCIFCKIVAGEIPCKKIYEDKDTLAFLDINPANPGHTLVVPKKHTTTIYDTNEETLGTLINVAKKISVQLKEKLEAKGVNVVQNNEKFAGQIVDHIHLHVIPRFENDFVVISYKRVQLSEEQLDKIKDKIKIEEKSDYDYFR